MFVLREVNGERIFPLRHRIVVIGRDPSCDVVTGSQQASKRHAMIVSVAGSYYVEDLDSSNGTYLNGKRVFQRTRLRPNDQLQLSGLTVAFQEEDVPVDPVLGSTVVLGETTRTLRELPPIMSSLEVSSIARIEIDPEAKLRAILELSKNLANTLALQDVIPKILESLFAIFPQADRGFILLLDQDTGQLVLKASRPTHEPRNGPPPVSQTVVQHALSTGRAILSADTGADQRFDPSQSIRRLGIRSILCAPLVSSAGTNLGVIQIDTQRKHQPFRQEDLDVLVSAAAQAARAIELAILHRDLRDLEAATAIQQSFLPHKRPEVEQLDFYDYYSPARQVGGDYYDYIPLPGNRLAIALGDVSGKGVSAALLMARLSAAARMCLAGESDIPAAIRHLSRMLTRSGTEDRFVTFLVVVLNLDDFTMTLVNAGHLAPLRRRSGRAAVAEIGDEIIGLPLAVMDKPYESLVMPLEPGDTYLLFTDGVTEARNPQGDLYGIDRLRAAVAKAPDDVESLGSAILADVRRFAAGRPQSDDLTVVCFSRRAIESPEPEAQARE